MTVSSVRITPDSSTVSENLGELAELAGTWEGKGFNLIARPNHAGSEALYLQLNQTQETLKIDPIGSSIPNRGFGQGDIELFGLTYLQKIADASTGGGLHIEPGIWITQPTTTYPVEAPPQNGQIVARMATIPHGNAVLAQGAATPITANRPPTLPSNGDVYAFSVFPSFNSTPFPIPPPPADPQPGPILNAAGSSEALTAPVPPGFREYDLGVPSSATNPRTPFEPPGTTTPPEPNLPSEILGVPMQDVVNDPVKILQAVIKQQVADGHTFTGTALNVSSRAQITFRNDPNAKAGDPTTVVDVADGAGGIENTLFLEGGEPAGNVGPNAETSLVYATFWIEKVKHGEHKGHFMQLQYAQMTILNFGIFGAPNAPILGWPHVSVATLRKSFV